MLQTWVSRLRWSQRLLFSQQRQILPKGNLLLPRGNAVDQHPQHKRANTGSGSTISLLWKTHSCYALGLFIIKAWIFLTPGRSLCAFQLQWCPFWRQWQSFHSFECRAEASPWLVTLFLTYQDKPGSLMGWEVCSLACPSIILAGWGRARAHSLLQSDWTPAINQLSE